MATYSSYQLGHLTGVILLAVLAIALVLRLVRSNSGSQRPPAPPPAWAPYPPSPAAATREPASGRTRTWTVVALVVVALAFISGVAHFTVYASDEGSVPAAYQSPQGTQMHDGFIGSCRHYGGSSDYCVCLWDQLTALPAYSTPAGFEALERGVETYDATKRLSDLPPGYLHAIVICRERFVPGASGSPGQSPA